MKLLIVLVIIVGAVAIGQLTRIYELTSKLRGKKEEEISDGDNRMNAVLMIVFMISLYAFLIWHIAVYGKGWLGPSASEHGKDIDWLYDINFILVLLVFFVTNTLLFVFAAKYYKRKGSKAYYYPHNNKLEMLWTVVPAVVLAVIIIFGLRTWNSAMSDPSQEARVVELFSRQFDWFARYSGENNKLGRADYKLITGENVLGVVTSETLDKRIEGLQVEIDGLSEGLQSKNAVYTDKVRCKMMDDVEKNKRLKERLVDLLKIQNDSLNQAAYDDRIFNELHLVKGKEYFLVFRSQDVIHSAYMPHFRVQMNTVPGMRTTFKFTPTISTDSMRVVLKDKYDMINKIRKENGKEKTQFNYWLLCNKICGVSHSNMKMKVVVHDTQEQYDAWQDAETKTFEKQVLGKGSEDVAEAISH